MTGSPLSPEKLRALTMLATAGRKGASQPSLAAHGFNARLIAGLVNKGFAALTHEKVYAGDKVVQVAKVRITNAGRRAIEG